MEKMPVKYSQRKTPARALRTLAALAVSALWLVACGHDDDDDGVSNDGWVPGVFRDASEFKDFCEDPRSGTSPVSGEPVPDRQGTTTDENNWLRSMSHDLYLWYDEITDRNPNLYSTPNYFDLLKTEQTTDTGAPKDQFHFTYTTEEWVQISQGGVSAGYGANFAIVSGSPPREVVVSLVEPGSPAADAGLNRGTQIIAVDGELVENGNSETLNAGLFPDGTGETHEFEVQLRDADTTQMVTLTTEEITSDPVRAVSTFTDVNDSDVGYLVFNDHIATAESQLVAAMEQFETDGVDDLILDLRYNGGGFLAMASEMAYMIAGDSATDGRIFETITFNDKHPNVNPVTGQMLEPTPFYSTTQGFSTSAGNALPTLNLDRVFVITGRNTCSASESIMNSLRGVGIEVYQFGATTCGKPYGFYAMHNCGTSYFTIQFKGENDQGFGEYAGGFTPENGGDDTGVAIPGCSVGDDLTRALGDEAEGRLAAALDYRESLIVTGVGTCPDQASSSATGLTATGETAKDLSNTNAYVPKEHGLEGKIMR